MTDSISPDPQKDQFFITDQKILEKTVSQETNHACNNSDQQQLIHLVLCPENMPKTQVEEYNQYR